MERIRYERKQQTPGDGIDCNHALCSKPAQLTEADSAASPLWPRGAVSTNVREVCAPERFTETDLLREAGHYRPRLWPCRNPTFDV